MSDQVESIEQVDLGKLQLDLDQQPVEMKQSVEMKPPQNTPNKQPIDPDQLFRDTKRQVEASFAQANNKAVVSTGDWFIYFCVLSIPFINIIVILWDAFGSNRNENKRNFCRALLIIFVLTIIVCVICTFAMIAAFGAVMEQFENLNIDELLNIIGLDPAMGGGSMNGERSREIEMLMREIDANRGTLENLAH